MEKEINPKISIVIPNYNNEKYITKCLESIVTQTYKNIEIIIVDDCSTDKSINIIKKLQKQDSRIILIINEKNKKVSETRHIGIINSTSEWITTLDSDDFLYSKNKIEKEVEVLRYRNFDKKIIAYSGIIHVNEKGENISQIMRNDNIKTGYIFEDIITRNCAIPRDFIFSKELYNLVNGYDKNIPIYEDWDLKIRLSKVANFLYTEVNGIAYRRHDKGLSSAKQEDHRKWVEHIFDKNTKNLKNKILLKSKLKENFNFNDELDYDFKEKITEDIKKAIVKSKITDFSIWGIGELTGILLKKLTNYNIKINDFIDSRAKYENIEYYNKKVITLKSALDKGETNFIIVSWNKKELLKSILEEETNKKNLTNIMIISPE